MFRLELLVQRKKVEEEYKKLQTLVDNELEDITFMSFPHSEYILFTNDIFQKQKRQRDEDIIGEQSQKLILEGEVSQSALSFVVMVEQ
jgi:hypothetical protein